MHSFTGIIGLTLALAVTAPAFCLPPEPHRGTADLGAYLVERCARCTFPQQRTPKVTVFESREPNAFAEPDGSVSVSSALLSMTGPQNGLEFVLAHEIAHLKLGHHLPPEGERKAFVTIEQQIAAELAADRLAIELLGGDADSVELGISVLLDVQQDLITRFGESARFPALQARINTLRSIGLSP